MFFVVARPLNPVEFFQSLVAHARVHWAQLAQLVPNCFGVGFTPVMPQAPRELINNLHVVEHAVGQRHGRTHALHAAFAACHRAFGLAPSGRAGENHVRHFCRLGVKKILDYHEFQSAKQFHGAMPVRLRIHGIFSQHVQRG